MIKRLALIALILAGASVQASEFKSLCLGFGPSVDLSAPFQPAIHINDPYFYNFEEDKLDEETELVYEEAESCTATSAGFIGSQITRLAEACEETGGIAREEQVEDIHGIIPVSGRFKGQGDRQRISCLKNPRNATLDEILDRQRGFRIIPLGGGDSSFGNNQRSGGVNL